MGGAGAARIVPVLGAVRVTVVGTRNGNALLGWLILSVTVHAVAVAAIPSPSTPGGPAGGAPGELRVRLGSPVERDDPGHALANGLATATSSHPVLRPPEQQNRAVADSGPTRVVATSSKAGAGAERLDGFPRPMAMEGSSASERLIALAPSFAATPPLPGVRSESAMAALGLSSGRASARRSEPVETDDASVAHRPAPFPRSKPPGLSHHFATRRGAPAAGRSADLLVSPSREPGGADISRGRTDIGEDRPGPRSDLESLLALLHQAISERKRYPSMARRQSRQGTTTVAFALHPDGGIDQVDVIRSSGFGQLDRAALLAVQEVAPFSKASRYLDRPERFEVSVVFSLN